jgi:hypothetical protein
MAAAFGALASCATLNTMGMSPFCRDSYNLCLDGCPKPPEIDRHDIDTITPSCVDQCNKNAETCK